jgi:hypothetical protein
LEILSKPLLAAGGLGLAEAGRHLAARIARQQSRLLAEPTGRPDA